MQNIGKMDQRIRIIIGLLILSLFFFAEGNVRYFGILGIIPLFTALTGKCALYKVFGINTKKDNKDN